MTDMALDVLRRNRFVDFLNRLADFDKALDVSWEPSLRVLKLRLLGFIVTVFLVCSLIVYSSIRTFVGTYLNMILYVLNYLGAALAIFKLSGAMYLLKERFGRLNDLAMKNGLGYISPKVRFPRMRNCWRN
jgi:hypothetical protein